MVVKFGESSIL